jgi:hypothetical protein
MGVVYGRAGGIRGFDAVVEWNVGKDHRLRQREAISCQMPSGRQTTQNSGQRDLLARSYMDHVRLRVVQIAVWIGIVRGAFRPFD